MALTPKYDRLLDDIRESDADPFITDGTNGISTIRMESSGGYVYDFTITDGGAWQWVLVSSPGVGGTTGSPMGLLLALTYA